MEARADELFSSAADVSNSMPYELSWSPPAKEIGQYVFSMWVFWSCQNNELRNLLSRLYPGIDTSSFENRTITEKIKAVLRTENTCWSSSCLIQFWAPVRTGDRIYLTMADQPFGLSKFHKGLCSYRKLCVSEILIPVHVNEPGDEEEHNLGPQLARVFRRGLSEWCDDMSCYFSEEYPLRDYVVQRGVQCCCILPLFETVGGECMGVLEILSTSCYDARFPAQYVYKALEARGLESNTPWSCKMSNDVNMLILKDQPGQWYAEEQMEDICQSHQIPFAQMWVAGSTTREITRISRSWGNFEGFDVAFRGIIIREGEGVVGKAFSLRSACFCNNLSKLSMSMYPSAQIARQFRVAACFAICLQSTLGGIFYILEFFLASGVDYGDPRNFVNKLVTTLKRNIESATDAPLQNVGEKLFVEVLKISSDDELDSFEIRTGSTPWVFQHPEGREMMQDDYQMVGETNDVSAEQNDDFSLSRMSELPHNTVERASCRQPLAELDLNKDIDIVSGKQYEIATSGFVGPINRNVGDKLCPASLSASESICSIQGSNTVPTHGDETTQENVNTKLNIAAGSRLTTGCSRISVAQSLSLSQESVAMEGNSSIMVMAKYGVYTIKIPLSFSSGKRELEEEVTKRLDLSAGSFKIKYLDEDGDPILVACDADVRNCMRTLISLDKNTINMLILN